MTEHAPVRVVGCGSPLGDDAAGWQVVQHLRDWAANSTFELSKTDLEFHLADGGHQILDVLDGRGTLILVDAICSNSPPGTILRFEWPDTRLECLRPGSTHHVRPAEALRLATALGLAPPRVIVFGIGASQFRPQTPPAAPVAAAARAVAHLILAEFGHAHPICQAMPSSCPEGHR